MAEPGEVRAVAWMPQGSELVADVAVGALSLPIDNPVDFDEDGGTLDLNGAQFDYDTVDPDLAIITLSSATTAAASAGDRVNVISGGAVVIDYLAFVSLGDGDEVEVPIPYAQRDMWPEGEYDSPVLVELSDDLETIVAVPGRTPVRDGSFINPATLPAPVLTDGIPPASSPAATVIGGLGALFVRWTAITNHDPVTYEVHISTSTGFTPSAATKATEVTGTSTTIRAMPDGTALAYWSDPPTNSVAQLYYVRLVAKDADPGAAPPGTEGSGSLVQINSPDVAASYVYAGTLVADQIIGGSISSDVLVSSRLSTALTGQRVEMSNEGLNLYAADGSALCSIPTDPASFVFIKGQAELDRTTINGNMTMRGTTNEISSASSLSLAGKVNNPTTPPVAQIVWDQAADTWLTQNPDYVLKGLDYYPTKNAWMTANFFVGTQIMLSDVVNGGYFGSYSAQWNLGDHHATHWFNSRGGFCLVGGFLYVMGIAYKDSDNSGQWEIRKYSIAADSSSVTQVAYLVKGPVTSYAQNPAMGVDRINGLPAYAYYNAAGNLRFAKIDPTTLADSVNQQIGTTTNPTGDGVRSLSYFELGYFDYGGATQRIQVAHENRGTVFGFSGTLPSMPRDTAMDFTTPSSQAQMGAVFGGPDSVFHTMTPPGKVQAYSNITWAATDSSLWHAGFTLNDTNAAGTGTHTTGLSAKTSFTMTKRAKLALTAPTIQTGGTDDPDSVKFYVGRGSSPPADTGMILNASPALGVNTVTLATVSFAGTGAPTNNFPASSAAKVVDASGNTLMDATGFGVWAPPGTINMYAGATPPLGWLLCDGTAVSRTIYATLFAVIGTTWGAGDGSTTFNLPDMRRRFPWGVSSLGGVPLGFSDQVAVVTDRNPQHSHGGNTGSTGSGHTHGIVLVGASNAPTSGTTDKITRVGGGAPGGSGDTDTTGSGHTHNIVNASVPGSASGTVAFPNMAFNFLIKT